MLVNRRSFLQSTATSAAAFVGGHRHLAAQEQPASDAFYKRANTDWLAQCRFGIGVHWTAQTVPRTGSPLGFQRAVDAFDLDGFIKEKIKAWWFDSPYSLDPRGPHNSVTTDMTGFQFPWEEFTTVAKRGDAARLVTYNAGVDKTFLYTTHQDYWAGEMVNLDNPARGRYFDNGIQWFGWTCLEDRRWVHTKLDTPIRPPLYTDEQVIGYVQTCNSHQAPMTFNVGI